MEKYKFNIVGYDFEGINVVEKQRVEGVTLAKAKYLMSLWFPNFVQVVITRKGCYDPNKTL